MASRIPALPRVAPLMPLLVGLCKEPRLGLFGEELLVSLLAGD